MEIFFLADQCCYEVCIHYGNLRIEPAHEDVWLNQACQIDGGNEQPNVALKDAEETNPERNRATFKKIKNKILLNQIRKLIILIHYLLYEILKI